jgi:Replication initiator protein A
MLLLLKFLDRGKKTMEQVPGPEATVAPPSPLPACKDELNLAEFPIALLTDRVPSGQKTIEFQDQIYDERKGQVITRRLVITASDKYGLPTSKDDEVILGLIQLTKQANDFTDRRVDFTRLDLLKLLGWENTGQNYQRIVTSLCRWTGVFLYWENAWWDKQQQAWTTKGFHIIESFEINDGRVSGGRSDLPPSRFTWNEVVFRSFQAGYLKGLDLDCYLGLTHPTSKRIYRFLDKRFYHRRDWTFDLRQFAHEHIGLSRAYADSGKIKEKLRPALEELEAIGFLEPLGCEDRYTKVGRGQWKISLIRKAPGPADPGTPPESGPSGLAAALIGRGVTPATAAELIGEYPAERIDAKLEVFDWLLQRKDRRAARSPAGYLVESIRGNYAAPKGFESEADRSRRLEAEEEQRRARAEARHQGQTQERAREEALQARITAYWDALSPDDREALRERALAQPHPLLSLYRRHRGQGTPAERRYLKLILDAHIIELLGEG